MSLARIRDGYSEGEVALTDGANEIAHNLLLTGRGGKEVGGHETISAEAIDLEIDALGPSLRSVGFAGLSADGTKILLTADQRGSDNAYVRCRYAFHPR